MLLSPWSKALIELDNFLEFAYYYFYLFLLFFNSSTPARSRLDGFFCVALLTQLAVPGQSTPSSADHFLLILFLGFC